MGNLALPPVMRQEGIQGVELAGVKSPGPGNTPKFIITLYLRAISGLRADGSRAELAALAPFATTGTRAPAEQQDRQRQGPADFHRRLCHALSLTQQRRKPHANSLRVPPECADMSALETTRHVASFKAATCRRTPRQTPGKRIQPPERRRRGIPVACHAFNISSSVQERHTRANGPQSIRNNIPNHPRTENGT
jgi:hypothetical protein